MDPERWRQVEKLYHAALELEGSRRGAFLQESCGPDHDLRHEVESLLASDAAAGSFIEAPAVEMAAKRLAKNRSILAMGKDSLKTGARISHYEILGKLGSGGMGEVYRARDIKLGRGVALKVLPEAFARDAERMARFQREAQVLASLNHPNIGSIYGFEESGGVRALVMELVEGPTLAELLETRKSKFENRKSPASPATSFEFRSSSFDPLPIARQIVEALEYAHEHGIIHRELKPANVKVIPDGAVKVLDFGLAKALASDVSGTNLANSPTISIAATEAGVILGTAAYMSPEQAKGKSVDRRTDIWAFGCVLYEMLADKKAFEGETVSDVLAAVIMRQPNWTALPASTPTSIRRLLSRCLEKDSRRRLQAIGEARIAIEESLSGTESAAADSGRRLGTGAHRAPLQPRHRVIIWSVALLAALSLGVALWSLVRAPQPPTRPITRFVVPLPPTDRLALGLTPVLALSPDGSRLVYVANRAGTNHLYVRFTDRFEATPIPGTEGAESPFFSPDGQSVGFFAEGKLKKVSLSGGAPLTLSSTPANRGGSWGPDDTIIFTPSAPSGLYQVSVGGGTPKVLTVPDHTKGEYSHRWPEILPGGNAVLFTVWTGASSDEARIDVLSLGTGEPRALIEGGAYARYAPSGYLVYARGGGLLAVPFDVKRLEVTGPPVSILEGVSMNPGAGEAEFSFSIDGSLAYVPGGSRAGERVLVWVDRNGAAHPLPAPPNGYITPRLSPDGQRVAVGVEGADSGLWLYEMARGTLTRLAASAPLPYPTWTPDGKRVTFRATLNGPMNLYWMPADGSSAAERLTTSENFQYAGSWSPDGRVLTFSEADPATGWNIWVLKLDGDRKPRPFLQTPSNESGAIFSPDGNWLAYQSDESGRNEIYVRPFPGPGGKSQISSEGGTEPMWARSGLELFYRNGDKMMAAAVETKLTFAAAKPKLLFEGKYETCSYNYLADYDVGSDGQRFLMIKGSEQESAATQINVVLNWFEDLKRRVPTGK